LARRWACTPASPPLPLAWAPPKQAQSAELERLHALFARVGAEPYPDPDVSAADWLRGHGASTRMLAVADACYANDFGCSLDQLGLREMITESRRWDSGACSLLAQAHGLLYSWCCKCLSFGVSIAESQVAASAASTDNES